MKPTVGLPTHYQRVSALHISAAQIHKDTEKELVDLLKMKTCILRILDLSNTQIDGSLLASALAVNSSLRSLDVRMVPSMADSYEVSHTYLQHSLFCAHAPQVQVDLHAPRIGLIHMQAHTHTWAHTHAGTSIRLTS